jgi:4-hydroxy-3-methylbut-2-en-1-yl diphosphate reductase
VQPLVIYRKGLDLKDAVAGELAADYHSALVETMKTDDYRYASGRLTVHLAREFGFCYGVDRAVDYAYQARKRFADRPVYLTGEIIHNPHVNDKLRAAGIQFLSDPDANPDALGPDSVVILPAFGVTIAELERFQRQGCTLVDTTCGSVLNVWKNVTRYARDGYTAIIHGKYKHEETRATASQALEVPGGRYLVVLDKAEAARVCEYIRRSTASDPARRAEFLQRFGGAISPGFDPDLDLQRIGCANQTTMLSSESLEVGEMFRQAMSERYGEAELGPRFRAFDTICSATQDRQDAVVQLLQTIPLDLMIVVGGYNSSNTCNLARICAAAVPTYHVADPSGLVSAIEIKHRPVGGKQEIATRDWLPASGPVQIGLTSGASTPDNLVEDVVRKLEAFTASPTSLTQ